MPDDLCDVDSFSRACGLEALPRLVASQASLRILFVADFNWFTGREQGTANLKLFDVRTKLANAAVRAGHTLVTFSDRAVARGARRPLQPGAGARAAARRFLQAVDELQPHVVLLHFPAHIDVQVLHAARRLAPGVRIAEINVDPLSSPRNRERLATRRDVVDAAFVTTAGPMLRACAGRRSFVAYMPNPADRAVETGRAFARDDARFDLALPANDDGPRQIGAAAMRPSEALSAIRQGAPGMRIASPGLGQDKVRGQRYFEVLDASRVGWSLSRYNSEPLYASARMIHMMASGLLTLVDRRSGLDRFYGEDEAAFYSDLDDLTARLRGHLADDGRRRAAAEAGWRRTWALFDSGRVLDYLLDQLFDAPRATDYGWPGERWFAA